MIYRTNVFIKSSEKDLFLRGTITFYSQQIIFANLYMELRIYKVAIIYQYHITFCIQISNFTASYLINKVDLVTWNYSSIRLILI